MVQIMIIIYTMLNIYTIKQKSLGYRFLLRIIMQNQVQDFIFIFWATILFTKQLTTLYIFI